MISFKTELRSECTDACWSLTEQTLVTHFLAGVPAEDLLRFSQPNETDHLPPGLERDAAADQSVSPAPGFCHILLF